MSSFGCSVAEIIIPDTVEIIDDYAFRGYYHQLNNIFIPANVTKIGECAFAGNKCLNITTSSDNKNYSSLNGVLFNKDKTELIAYSKDKTSSAYTIPNTVSIISDCAFYDCPFLTELTIPESVTKIGAAAFFNCKNLKNLIIPNSVTDIDHNAFWCCEKLENITLSENISRISSQMFLQCYALDNIVIPNNVTCIEDEAFQECKSLTDIALSDNITNLGGWVFKDSGIASNPDNWSDGVLYIGNYLVEANDTVPTVYAVKPDTTLIASDTLGSLYSHSIKKIIMPDSITAICGGFWFKNALTDIYYAGSEEQWKQINILEDSYKIIANAEKHFNSQGPQLPKLSGKPTVIKTQPSKYIVTVPLEKIEYDSNLISIAYSKNTFSSSTIKPLIDGDTEKTFDISSADNIDSVKLFIWDSLQGMRPLCDSITITAPEFIIE